MASKDDLQRSDDTPLESHGLRLEERRIKKLLCEHVRIRVNTNCRVDEAVVPTLKEKLHPSAPKGKRSSLDNTNRLGKESTVESTSGINSGRSSLVTSNGAWVNR